MNLLSCCGGSGSGIGCSGEELSISGESSEGGETTSGLGGEEDFVGGAAEGILILKFPSAPNMGRGGDSARCTGAGGGGGGGGEGEGSLCGGC